MAKTKINYKVVSHNERMLNKELHKKARPDICPETVEMMVEELENHDGYIVSALKAKRINPRKNFEGFKVLDFAMDNLKATGAVGSLSHCSLEGNFVDSINNAVAGLEKLDNINISNEN